MPIRYKCETCGSTLTIKEELAGTQGKCPKCKTAFRVPEPSSAAPASPSSKGPTSSRKKPAVAKTGGSTAADEDFDPMAVLMGEDAGESPSSRGAEELEPLEISDNDVPSELDLELRFDEIADDETTKKPKKRKRVQFDSDDEMDVESSAAAVAGTVLSGGASAGAKDLLTKTMEESRARASRIDEEKPKYTGPTIRDYVREFGPKGFAIVVGFLVGVLALYNFAGMMYGGGMDLPDLARVYGTVTLDGAPLEGAKVRFTPVDRTQTVQGKAKQRLRSSTALTDEEGYYDLYYAEGIRGAAITEHRIMIKKLGEKGRLLTPVAYSDFSLEKRTVESGSQEINFELESDRRPRAEPANPQE